MSGSPTDFDSDEFSVKSWINAQLAPSNQGDLTLRLSSLVSQLELWAVDANRIVEQNGAELLTGVPRAVEEVELINIEGVQARNCLQQLLTQLSLVDQQNTTAVRFLTAIDRVKARVDTCGNLLQEVNSWESSVLDIEAAFDARDLASVADQLVAMSTGLERTRALSDFSTRENCLKSIRVRLEAMAMARLVYTMNASFDEKDRSSAEGELRTLLMVFSKIQRLEIVRTEYLSSRRSHLGLLCQKSLCTGAALREPSSSTQVLGALDTGEADALSNRLSDCSEELLDFLALELNFCFALFPGEGGLAVQLVEALTEELGSAFARWLEAYLRLAGPVQALCLAKASSACEAFLQRLFSLLSKSVDPALQVVMAGFDSVLASRVLAPVAVQLQNYPAMESMWLQHELATLIVNPCAVRRLVLASDARALVFAAARESLGRCVALGAGLVGPALINEICMVLQRVIGLVEAATEDVLRQLASSSSSDNTEARAERQARESKAPSLFFDDSIDAGPDSTVEPLPSPSLLAKGQSWEAVPAAFALLNAGSLLRQELCTFAGHAREQLGAGARTSLVGSPALRLPIVAKALLSASDRLALEALATPLSSADGAWFSDSIRLLDQIMRNLREGLLEALCGPVASHLDTLASHGIWRAEAQSGRLEGPLFSAQPSGLVTQVGEYWLVLLNQIEPFLTEPDSPNNMSQEVEASLPRGGATAERESAGFWVANVASRCLSLTMAAAQRIPRLSVRGSMQLACDLDYLMNILQMLGVTDPQMSLLPRAIALLSAGPDEARARRNEWLAGVGQSHSAVLQALLASRRLDSP